MHLGPDGGWNPLDELILPYDRDLVEKPVDNIESISNDSLSNKPAGITKHEQSSESSLSEQEPSSHHINVSIWKDKNTVPWEDIKKSTSNNSCDSVNELECKTEIKHNNISSENVIDSNKKLINNDLSVITEQHICDIENVKHNTTSQNLPNLELQLNNLKLVEYNGIDHTETNVNLKKPSLHESLVNGHLECLDTKEVSSQTKCIDNVPLEDMASMVSDNSSKVDSPNNMHGKMFNNDLSVNNNNNIIKNDVGECIGVCDFESTMPIYVNESLPNRTSQEQNEIIEKYSPESKHISDQISVSQTNYGHNELSQNIFIPIERKTEQNVDLNNLDCSIFQNQQNNDIHFEDNIDTEFDDFCDFHAFSTSTIENNPISVDNFSDFKTSTSTFNDTIELKNLNIEQENQVVTKYDDDLTFKLDNKNNTIKKNNSTDDNDIFCDFESSDVSENQTVFDDKKSDLVLDSDFQDKLDYKQFCKDAFQGDYVSFL